MHSKLFISSPDADNICSVRLSEAYREMIGEIITCLPKVKRSDMVKPGQQLLSFETNRCLASIRSPFGGRIIDMAGDTMNLAPGDITSDTVLFQIRVS